jgi:hypothetical protein
MGPGARRPRRRRPHRSRVGAARCTTATTHHDAINATMHGRTTHVGGRPAALICYQDCPSWACAPAGQVGIVNDDCPTLLSGSAHGPPPHFENDPGDKRNSSMSFIAVVHEGSRRCGNVSRKPAHKRSLANMGMHGTQYCNADRSTRELTHIFCSHRARSGPRNRRRLSPESHIHGLLDDRFREHDNREIAR